MKALPIKSINIADFIVRIFLGGIFLWASVDKIIDPSQFAQVVANYKILPGFMVAPVALLLPWVEALCGICLIANRLVLGSLLIINSLMVVFIAAFILNLYRGIDVSCGCFSLTDEAERSAYYYLARDFVFLLPGLWLFWYRVKALAVSRPLFIRSPFYLK